MKKISLILLGVFGLLFSTNVYADDCLDYATCPITVITNPFNDAVFTNSVYTTDSNSTQSDLFTEHFTLADNWDFSYNETGFGRYSDGTIIGSYRFDTSGNWFPLKWYRYTGIQVDPNTGVTNVYLDINNSRRIDFNRTWTPGITALVGKLSFRFDFAIHLDFYDHNNNNTRINNKISRSIFNGIFVEIANTNGVTCFSQYDTNLYNINVTCTGALPKSLRYSIIFNNIKDTTSLQNDSQDYDYVAEIGFSDATMMTSPTGALEDLITDKSPNGDNFNDYYKKVEIQSDNYFDNFRDFNFGGLTEIITSPLAFVRSLSSSSFDSSISQYTCSVDPLKINFNLFNHNVCVPSGLIFWGRLYNDSSKQSLLDNFHMTWNLLVGGFIIYKLCVVLYRKLLNALDPYSNDEVESL